MTEQKENQTTQRGQEDNLVTNNAERKPEQKTAVQQNTILIQGQSKSVGLGVLLALFFGPIGLLYSSIMGGLFMMVVGCILFFLIPIIGIIITDIICIIWAIVAIGNHNNRQSDKQMKMVKAATQ